MTRYYVVHLEDLAVARAAYESNEPRDLFYRVARAVIADSESGREGLTVVDGLAALLQTWNRGWYQRQRHKFDAAHYADIARLLEVNQADLSQFRNRSLEVRTEVDRPSVERLFDRFVAVLGPVGSAKALHLLAPRWFPIFDNRILDAFHVWGRDGAAYWRFMTAVLEQVRLVGGEAAAGATVLKALDELSFCRFTLRLQDFGEPSWVELEAHGPDRTSRLRRAGEPLASTKAARAGDAPWGSKSAAMRALFEQGVSIANTAREVGVDYAFAYGVYRRWKAKQGR